MARERSGSDTRIKILEVAEREFAREGYAGAHLQGIAQQVGVQKTALYYYFDSKSALYDDVLRRMLGDFDRTLREATSAPGTPAERLERLLDSVNALLSERRNYAQLLIRLFVDHAPISTSLRPVVEGVVSHVLTFYSEGVAAGCFAKLSARHLFQSLMGLLVFHYATDDFGAAVIGESDLFTHRAVDWRRNEVKRFVLRAVLLPPPNA